MQNIIKQVFWNAVILISSIVQSENKENASQGSVIPKIVRTFMSIFIFDVCLLQYASEIS